MSAPTSEGTCPDVTLVVLAAGRATRYGGVKPLAAVGPGGEAVLDVLASDALAAGFERLVLVVGPETGPALRYHVSRGWPRGVPVEFAVQDRPRGTVDAVLSAAHLVGEASPFGVANADDLPGEAGLALLAGHLRGTDAANAAVCYRLSDSLLGDAPVTRGLCSVDDDGMLVAVDERRQVTPLPGGRVVSGDGREPAELDPDQPVSVNLWGFRPELVSVLRAAMESAGGHAEVLLPDVVDELLTERRTTARGATAEGATAEGATAARSAIAVRGATAVRVLRVPGRCIGVTHAGDVALVQAELAREIGRGDRSAQLWGAPLARA